MMTTTDCSTEATTTEPTYQSFTYEQLAKDYSYDPVGGSIISNHSGKILSNRTGSMNKNIGGNNNTTLRMNIVAMILHQGYVEEGQEVRVLDRDKSNLKLSNLCAVGLDDEPDRHTYCKPTTKYGVVENVYRGCFLVRGNREDAVFFTKTFEEAVEIRDFFELTGILPKHPEAPNYPDWMPNK